jgi:tRNA nucleotidyltransferase (CCA-adding enzyme)
MLTPLGKGQERDAEDLEPPMKMTTTARWEHFPHGADVGVRGIGRSKEEAFEQAALALTAVIADPDAVLSKQAVEIVCGAQDDELGLPDDELMLVDWLNAIVYEMATRRMLFGRFEVTFEGDRLQAKAWGEPLDPARHQPAVEVKGATYTELRVCQDQSGQWKAQCVVDV